MSMVRKMARRQQRNTVECIKASFQNAAKRQKFLSEAEYNNVAEELKPEMVRRVAGKMLAVACAILENHYGALKKKETRYEKFAELFLSECEKQDAPSLTQIDIEKKLKKYDLTVVFK